MKPVCLVIDTGSSQMRGILFDASGSALYTKQVKYSVTVDNDGSAVMEISVYTSAITEIVEAAANHAAKAGLSIIGLSLDSQRSSVLPVLCNGQPLYPILTWYDRRSGPICEELTTKAGTEIYRHSGMRLSPVTSAPKMLWLKRKHPEIYEAADLLVGIHDYLLFFLTGRWVTDATCACRSGLMEITTFSWSKELFSIFGLAEEKLCSIVRPGTVVGRLTDRFCKVSGLPPLPVVTAGGDQQCCVFGQRLANEHTISVNNGSASYIAKPLSNPFLDEATGLNLSAYPGRLPWVLEASNMGSGTAYQWFHRQFYAPNSAQPLLADIDAEVTREAAGSHGVLCLPDLAGRGAPYTDPNARGCFFGIGLNNTRASFARALTEGICLDIWDGIRAIAAHSPAILEISSTGGLANLPAFNQILADVTNIPVALCAETETTAFGAFLCAAPTLFGQVLSLPVAQPSRRFLPNSRHHALYCQLDARRSQLRKILASQNLHFE